ELGAIAAGRGCLPEGLRGSVASCRSSLPVSGCSIEARKGEAPRLFRSLPVHLRVVPSGELRATGTSPAYHPSLRRERFGQLLSPPHPVAALPSAPPSPGSPAAPARR